MEASTKAKALAVIGPTACGKTAFAVRLARAFSGEIVGADSRQVYRRLDIGSGKDLAEYGDGGAPVPFHMIDVAEPGEPFNLSEYVQGATAALSSIASKGRLPILAGGSALYIDALLKGYALPGGPPDEELRGRLAGLDANALSAMLSEAGEDPGAGFGEEANRARLLRRLEMASTRSGGSGAPKAAFEADWLVLGVRVDRKEMHRRIEARLDARLKGGMIEEVAKLHESGVSWERLEWFGLEYRHLAWHLQGRLDYASMREALLIKIRQFAKRQDSWFRKMEREGVAIHWLGPQGFEEASDLLSRFLAGRPLPAPDFRLMNVKFGP